MTGGRERSPRICLSMIVRNEARTIERCLSAVLPLIDAAVICDTGSTDHTIARAAARLERARLPFVIVSHPWENFGVNRTRAIDAARAFMSADAWPLAHAYLLFVDADLELVVEPGFSRDDLTADAIDLQQRAGTLAYWNLRLARASLDWRAVGATHEYYEAPGVVTRQRLSGLWIRDHGDGGSRADKFSRDIALLTDALRRSPEDPRSLFYLAQSYRDAGDPIKALVLYRKRIAAGGWFEEVFYSQLSMGRILAASGDMPAAAAAFRAAAETDPARAEPAYELARVYRRAGRAGDAAAAAARGASLGWPVDRSLFLHRDVYEYGLDDELARSGWGTPDHDRGYAACARLAISHVAPDAVVSRARDLLPRYAAPIAGARFRRLLPDLPPPYVPCNPSIVLGAGDHRGASYTVVCRGVNYRQQGQWYRTLDPGGVIRTRNVLLSLDEEGGVLAEREIVIDEPPLRPGARIQGLEDCRLFEAHGSRWFTCTTTDRHPSGQTHMSLCRLDADGRVTRHRPLVGPFDDVTQKNWLPFADLRPGLARAIYGYAPLTVVDIDLETGRYAVAAEVPVPFRLSHWRGSAGPIRWPDGRKDRWLALVHEVVLAERVPGRRERIYLHSFFEMDDRFAVTRMSRPFVFVHKGVEFACGMCPSAEGESIVITFGVEDRAAYLCELSLAQVDAHLDAGTVTGQGLPT